MFSFVPSNTHRPSSSGTRRVPGKRENSISLPAPPVLTTGGEAQWRDDRRSSSFPKHYHNRRVVRVYIIILNALSRGARRRPGVIIKNGARSGRYGLTSTRPGPRGHGYRGRGHRDPAARNSLTVFAVSDGDEERDRGPVPAGRRRPPPRRRNADGRHLFGRRTRLSRPRITYSSRRRPNNRFRYPVDSYAKIIGRPFGFL